MSESVSESESVSKSASAAASPGVSFASMDASFSCPLEPLQPAAGRRNTEISKNRHIVLFCTRIFRNHVPVAVDKPAFLKVADVETVFPDIEFIILAYVIERNIFAMYSKNVMF